MKRSSVFFVFFIIAAALISGAPAAAEPAAATIELNDCAVFVRADEAVIKEIKTWAESEEGRAAADYTELKRILDGRYGDRVRSERFAVEKLSTVAGLRTVRLTVREAALTGRTPPIEGLLPEEAAAVLGMFGFTVAAGREFDALPEQEKIRLLNTSEGALLVLEGTGPSDELIIYYMEQDGERR